MKLIITTALYVAWTTIIVVQSISELLAGVRAL